MTSLNSLILIQDTIPEVKTNLNVIQKSPLSTDLNIERQNIKLGSIREIAIDSSRLQKAYVPRPIIKTIPFVPYNDSVEHPVFNVLNDNFILHDESSFYDHMNFTPVDPLLKFQLTTHKAASSEKPGQEVNTGLTREILSQKLVTKDRYSNTVGFRSTDWMLGIIIFALVIFSWLRVGYGRYFQAAIQASYNFFTARRIFEESNVTRNRVFYFMNFLFFVNISLFIAQLLDYNHLSIFKLHGIMVFLLCFVLVIIIYSGKSVILHLLDFLFLTRNGFSSYVFTVFLYNKMIGFLLLPIIAVLPFVPKHITPYLFVAGIGIILLLYIIRVFKGLQLGIKNRLSIFYLILYLCALEILPVLLILKVIKPYI